MKRFVRLLLVTVGFGALGFVMSLVPQKNATGAGGAPVDIINSIPLSVAVNNFPATLTGATVPVSLSSLPTTPLVTRDADNPARTPVQDVVCIVQLTSGMGFTKCSGYTVPAGKELVMEDLTGICGTPKGNTIELSVLPTVNSSSLPRAVLLNPGLSLPASDSFVISQTVRMYADPSTQLALQFSTTDLSGNTTCGLAFSGYLVTVP